MKVFILFFLTIIPFSFNNLYSEYSSTDYALAIQKERDILKNLRKSHQNLYRSLIKNKFKLKKLNKTIQAFTENKTMFWNIEDFISINKNIFNNSNESLSNKKNNIKKSLKIINNILNYFKLVEQNKDTNNFEIAKKESEIIKINNEIKDFEFTIKNLEKKIKKSLENIENKKNEVIDFRNSESHKKSMKLFLTNEDIKIKKSKILLKTTKNELYKKVENKNLRKSDLKNLRLKVKLKKRIYQDFRKSLNKQIKNLEPFLNDLQIKYEIILESIDNVQSITKLKSFKVMISDSKEGKENNETNTPNIKKDQYQTETQKGTTELIVSALSNFMVKRAQEEVFISFMKILGKKKDDFLILFPSISSQFKDDNNQYGSSLSSTLLYAMQKDLNDLPENILKLNHPFIKKEFIQRALIIKKIVNNLKKGFHPNEIFKIILEQDSISLGENKNCLEFIYFLSSQFYNTREGRWITIKEFNSLDQETRINFIKMLREKLQEKLKERKLNISNQKLRKLYSFLRSKNNINYSKTSKNTLKTPNCDNPSKKIKITKYVKEESELRFRFSEELTYFMTYINRLEKLRNYYYEGKNKNKTFFQLIDEIVNFMIDFIIPIEKDKKIENKKILKNYTSIIEASQNKKYGLMLAEISILLDYFSPSSTKKNDKNEEEQEYIKYKRYILKYGSIFADLIEAKEEKELEAIISRVVLPVSSHHLKKDGEGHLSLNGYVGVSLGFNLVSENNKAEDDKLLVTMFMPIGIEFSSKYLSLFAPVIDLGSYLANKNDKKFTDFKLQQIFAPGLYLFYHPFKEYPISIGFGYQYFPILNNSSIPVHRLGANISIDIPLFIW